MDNTIRIITDSGCDISKENEEKYKGLLEIMPFMVTIQGKSYVDRQDIQAEEFYKVLKEQQEIPPRASAQSSWMLSTAQAPRPAQTRSLQSRTSVTS